MIELIPKYFIVLEIRFRFLYRHEWINAPKSVIAY